MHQNSPFFSSNMEKNFWGGAQPPPYSPPPSAPTAPLAPRSYGARPRRLRHLGCPPDLLTSPPFPHTFRHVCPERKSHRAKVQGSESSRERKFKEMKWPGSKSAREQFGQGANRPGSYWPIRSGQRIGPRAKRLSTVYATTLNHTELLHRACL